MDICTQELLYKFEKKKKEVHSISVQRVGLTHDAEDAQE